MNVSGSDRWAAAGLPLKWDTLTGLRQDADVLLVQESRPPVDGTWQAAGISAWPPITERLKWHPVASGASPVGVVLLDDSLDVRPIEVGRQARSQIGTLVLCDVLRDDEQLLTVASAYGMFEDGDVSERSMRTIVEDLGEQFAAPGARVVLGGDFNMWIQPWRGAPYGPYLEVFELLEGYGAFDCLQAGVPPTRGALDGCSCGGGSTCTHVQTFRSNRPNAGRWQNDYIFASSALRSALKRCEVLDRFELWQASDHAPVVATFVL